MIENPDRLKFLLEKHISDTVNDTESAELAALIHNTEQSQVEDILISLLEQADPEFDNVRTAMILQKILQHDEAPIRLKKSRWYRPMAAALVAILMGAGVYFIFSKKPTTVNLISNTAKEEIKAPHASRAIITLADGKTVYLDSMGTGSVSLQGNVKLLKTASGQITYSFDGKMAEGELIYNTLVNPRGSKVVDLQLADGSRVWLNSGSSIKYPIAFLGNQRNVEITGEAYFEIAASRDPFKEGLKRPFIVKMNEVEIKVLGTHFNVNAYEDVIRTTLLEGSIKVSTSGHAVMVAPGQQATTSIQTSSIQIRKDVDLDEVMAWKNGYFYFRRASVQMVMNQLSRWYDVEVSYQGDIPDRHFEGEMQRNLSLAQVLDLLSQNNIHFNIAGKKIIVTP